MRDTQGDQEPGQEGQQLAITIFAHRSTLADRAKLGPLAVVFRARRTTLG